MILNPSQKLCVLSTKPAFMLIFKTFKCLTPSDSEQGQRNNNKRQKNVIFFSAFAWCEWALKFSKSNANTQTHKLLKKHNFSKKKKKKKLTVLFEKYKRIDQVDGCNIIS